MKKLTNLIKTRANGIIRLNEDPNYEYLAALTKETIESLKDKKNEFLASDKGVDKRDDVGLEFSTETIVSANRPILPIQMSNIVIRERDKDKISSIMKLILNNNISKLQKSIASVGRIELKNHFSHDWVGSGWVIQDSIIITNAHVVDKFAFQVGTKWQFRNGIDGRPIQASIDFIEEYGAFTSATFEILDILYYENRDFIDLAFLKIDNDLNEGTKIKPIKLSNEEHQKATFIASIGFPARDAEIPQEYIHTVDNLVGEVYNKKCLSPGQVMENSEENDVIKHDCSTIGGYSGAVVIDILTGKAIGLHFGGKYMEQNYAVSWKIIVDRLDRITNNTKKAKETPAINTSEKEKMMQVLESVKEDYKNDPNVTNIQLGYKFRNGWITKEKCIVFSVKHKIPLEEAEKSGVKLIPESINGVTTDVTFTSIENILEEKYGFILEARSRRDDNYEPPSSIKLEIIHEEMETFIGVSPDSGWSILKGFLNRINNKLSLAMYLMSAPHILKELSNRLNSKKAEFNMILDDASFSKGGIKKDDLYNEETLKKLKQDLNKPINFSWASSGLGEKWDLNQIFPYSYHIKLAVRDEEEIWVSSGSWQTTNQPNVNPLKDKENPNPIFHKNYNRESNVTIKNRKLAQVLNSFILHDIAEAKKYHNKLGDIVKEYVAIPKRTFIIEGVQPNKAVKYFPPLNLKRKIKLKPLLTPDNFGDSVLPLIQNAKREILFQNQTFKIRQSYEGHIVRLANALLEKYKQGIDVKIILRSDYSPREMITQLVDLGFSPDWIKVQSGCHNKSLIIDSEIAIVGSHNWTMAGVEDNRDASIIFYDEEIATYYKEIYDYDWINQAVKYIVETREGVKSINQESVSSDAELDDYWILPLAEFI